MEVVIGNKKQEFKREK